MCCTIPVWEVAREVEKMVDVLEGEGHGLHSHEDGLPHVSLVPLRQRGGGQALEHKTRELSHFLFVLKLVLAPKAVTLHWPVLPGQQESVEVRPGWLALSWGKQN